MKRALTRRGSMLISIVSKAISIMPATGTGRPANRLRAVLWRANGSRWPPCCLGINHECDKLKTDQGPYRRLGSRDRHGSPRPGHFELKAVLGCFDRIRRRAQQPCLAG